MVYTSYKTLVQVLVSGSFVNIADISAVNGPMASRTVIPINRMDSPAPWTESMPGLLEYNNIDVTAFLSFDPTQSSLLGYLTSGTPNTYRLSESDFNTRQVVFTANVSDVLTTATHGITTGTPVKFTSTGTLPAGLAANYVYYLSATSTTTLEVHLSNADAVAGTNVLDITSAGTGTHTLNLPHSYILPTAYVLNFSPTTGQDTALGVSFTISSTGPITNG